MGIHGTSKKCVERKSGALTTEIPTSETKIERFLSCLSPIHFHFSELPYGTPTPPRGRSKECDRGRVKHTGGEGKKGRGVLVWRWRGLLQLCTPVSISLNAILSSMCACSTAEKGNGNKVILLHTAQRKRERETTRERAREGEATESESNVRRERQGKKTSGLVRRPRQLENSRFKFSAFPLLCPRTLLAEWEGTSGSF